MQNAQCLALAQCLQYHCQYIPDSASTPRHPITLKHDEISMEAYTGRAFAHLELDAIPQEVGGVDHKSVNAPFARPEPQKCLKKSLPGASTLGAPRESGKSLEEVFSRLCRDFFDTFSRLSGGPGASGPRQLSSDFLGVSGPEGPRDACKWSTGSQLHSLKLSW